MRLLDSPSIASKAWVTDHQYDSMVQDSNSLRTRVDAAIPGIRGTEKGIAVKIDGNGRRHLILTSRQIAVAAARNVACPSSKSSRQTELANPEKPTGFWQFRRSVEEIAAASMS